MTIPTYVIKAWRNNLGLVFQPQDVQSAHTADSTRPQDALVKKKKKKNASEAIRKPNKRGDLYSKSMFVESIGNKD